MDKSECEYVDRKERKKKHVVLTPPNVGQWQENDVQTSAKPT